MTITTEEAERLARKMIDVAAGRSDTNWCNDAANMIRTLAAERDRADEEIKIWKGGADRLEAKVDKLQTHIQGVAKDTQAAMIGLVARAEKAERCETRALMQAQDWRTRAEKAEAEAAERDGVGDDWYASFAAEMKRRKAAEAEAEKMREALEQIAEHLPSFDYVSRDSYGHMRPDRPGSPYDRGKADASKHLSEIARAALNQGGGDGGEKAGHSERLRKGLSGVVKNLRARPPELRGPFKVPDLGRAHDRAREEGEG